MRSFRLCNFICPLVREILELSTREHVVSYTDHLYYADYNFATAHENEGVPSLLLSTMAESLDWATIRAALSKVPRRYLAAAYALLITVYGFSLLARWQG